MGEPTTITLPAYKQKSYGRNGGVFVGISGATVSGHGSTLAEAKASALDSLLALATNQQSGPAATVYRDGHDSLITVYYPQGSGTGTLNIRVGPDGMRITCTGSTSGTPSDAADYAAQQDRVTRL